MQDTSFHTGIKNIFNQIKSKNKKKFTFSVSSSLVEDLNASTNRMIRHLTKIAVLCIQQKKKVVIQCQDLQLAFRSQVLKNEVWTHWNMDENSIRLFPKTKVREVMEKAKDKSTKISEKAVVCMDVIIGEVLIKFLTEIIQKYHDNLRKLNKISDLGRLSLKKIMTSLKDPASKEPIGDNFSLFCKFIVTK